MYIKVVTTTLMLVLAVSSLQAGWGQGGKRNGDGNDRQLESLTAIDAEQLTFLREEEKLARDVYDAMSDIWGLFVFDNISSSEQRHMDAVLKQLDQYGLIDPALQPGVFVNADLQHHYDSLVMQGSQSQLEALQAGAYIEEMDMHDINDMIASTQHQGLIDMYETLLCGSRNHLRAFVRQIENRGVVYEAQVMEQREVDLIVDSSMERRCGRR
ncbi:MAG: DUF2202 domain-containing protein [Candidatus Thiodiazotropha sp.]|nr:DUF2202 domain-containing protein [Candidatus Thiodiazotropha sp.]MCM8882312.1 DUF2202 domain-containing protein [Candidatus Thiodiazotropha sp.]MCM8919634.1 DUF2202 domain-containing protein [Candidatus Thiodiazotropha sp.]